MIRICANIKENLRQNHFGFTTNLNLNPVTLQNNFEEKNGRAGY